MYIIIMIVIIIVIIIDVFYLRVNKENKFTESNRRTLKQDFKNQTKPLQTKKSVFISMEN